mgnify:FL=1
MPTAPATDRLLELGLRHYPMMLARRFAEAAKPSTPAMPLFAAASAMADVMFREMYISWSAARQRGVDPRNVPYLRKLYCISNWSHAQYFEQLGKMLYASGIREFCSSAFQDGLRFARWMIMRHIGPPPRLEASLAPILLPDTEQTRNYIDYVIFKTDRDWSLGTYALLAHWVPEFVPHLLVLVPATFGVYDIWRRVLEGQGTQEDHAIVRAIKVADADGHELVWGEMAKLHPKWAHPEFRAGFKKLDNYLRSSDPGH